MTILKFNDDEFLHRHIFDVRRIQQVLKNNRYHFSLELCSHIWEEYSEKFYAEWLKLPKDDNTLFEILKKEAEEII